jgi:hypothetical protein
VAGYHKSAYFQQGQNKSVGGGTMQVWKSQVWKSQVRKSNQPVLLKTYEPRRLYRPDIMSYLTCKDLMVMANGGEQFIVVDAKTGEDLTPSFHPVIVEH